jgi:hypothetical protein
MDDASKVWRLRLGSRGQVWREVVIWGGGYLLISVWGLAAETPRVTDSMPGPIHFGLRLQYLCRLQLAPLLKYSYHYSGYGLCRLVSTACEILRGDFDGGQL